MSAAARITMLGSLEERLRKFLVSHPKGHERAAAVLFRRHSHHIQNLQHSDRYVAVDVIPFEDNWINSSSPEHVDFNIAPLRELFRRCEEEGLVFGFAHNHPNGYPDFSSRDDENEVTLLQALGRRNGLDVTFVALLLSGTAWAARTRSAQDPHLATATRHVGVLDGRRLHLHGVKEWRQVDDDDILARQAAAFGRPFVGQMRSLRIAVIGASGTGSPTGTLLARSGAGELLFFDPDVLAKSNLNRIRGAKLSDLPANKAAWIRDYVISLGLETKAAAFASCVDEDPDAVDALATCDLIVGCTDDQIGRELINAACFAFASPTVDMGLGGWIANDHTGQVRLRGHYGRVSTVCPEAGDCLMCQGVVTLEGVRRQYALRESPALTEEQLKERYLTGGGEQAPGVGPFTSAVGDYAVATIYDMLTGFRRWPPTLRWDAFLIDFVLMELRSPESRADAACPFCGTRELLLRRSKYRLGRPALGASNVAL